MTRIKMPNDNNLKYNNVLGMESIKKKKVGFENIHFVEPVSASWQSYTQIWKSDRIWFEDFNLKGICIDIIAETTDMNQID